MSGEMPPWDGGPDRVLPSEAKVRPMDFTAKLMKEFAHPCGETVALGLHGGVIWGLSGAEATVSEDGEALIALWLPYWADQQLFKQDEHVPIGRADRWRGVELAFGVLARAWPAMPSEFGFLGSDGQGKACPWYEWPYVEPPEYVMAWWEPAEDEAEGE